MPTVTAMLKIVTLTASLLAIGTAILALPQIAEARFGGAAIAEAAASLDMIEQVQHRRQQPQRQVTRPQRAPASSATTIDSTYRYPGSRGALDSCAFC
jgi:hypothetical protein